MKDNQELMIRFAKIVERHPEIYDHNLEAYKTRQVDAAWEKIASSVKIELKEECTAEELKIKWKGIRSSFNRYKNKLLNPSDSNPRKKYYLYDTLKFLDPFTRPKGFSGSKTSVPAVNLLIDGIGSSVGFQAVIVPVFRLKLATDSDILRMLGHSGPVFKESLFEECGIYEDDSKSNGNNSSDDWNVAESKPDISNNRIRPDPLNHQKINNLNTSEHSNCGNSKKRKYSSEDKGLDDDNEDLQFFKSILPDIRDFTNKEKRKLKMGILRLIDDLENERKQQ